MSTDKICESKAVISTKKSLEIMAISSIIWATLGIHTSLRVDTVDWLKNCARLFWLFEFIYCIMITLNYPNNTNYLISPPSGSAFHLYKII